MTLKERILDGVAKNLREFGYPDATAQNVATTKLFAMFGKDQVQDFMDEKCVGNPEAEQACREILTDMEQAIANG